MIKAARLADDDRASVGDEDGLDVGTFGHQKAHFETNAETLVTNAPPSKFLIDVQSNSF